MAKASFTVEAVFVVSICIWVLVALCYGGMYVHDRAVMASDVNSIVNRELIQRMNEDEGKSRKEINEHLYLLKILIPIIFSFNKNPFNIVSCIIFLKW